ncbi:MAG: hypothetical protein JOZ04_06705 [Acidimicrobiia bacterium]|nr:hypothetical protein [Acidimicrobiia bacterium]
MKIARLLSSRTFRFLAVGVTFLLLADAAAAYQVGVREKRPPSFRRGGRFVEAGPGPAGVDAPGDTTTTTAAVAASDFGTAASSTSATTGRRSSSTATRGPTTTATAALAAAGSPVPGNGPPATGTYTWATSGTESVSGFGSRSFPPTMTMVAHRDPGLAPDETVLDTTYSSNHTEREILGIQNDGIYFDYEAGQVRFGPMAQSNQGDYKPPMLQVPFPLAAGVVRTGTTQVLASDGSVERTEHWTVRVIDQETIEIAGRPVLTWKVTVDRQGQGSNQSVTRSRTLWFYPPGHLWVKYTEQMHGEQNYGITFTYDENVTATLESFVAG